MFDNRRIIGCEEIIFTHHLKNRIWENPSSERLDFLPVMAGLVPAIHVFGYKEDGDARHEAGHDKKSLPTRVALARARAQALVGRVVGFERDASKEIPP